MKQALCIVVQSPVITKLMPYNYLLIKVPLTNFKMHVIHLKKHLSVGRYSVNVTWRSYHTGAGSILSKNA